MTERVDASFRTMELTIDAAENLTSKRLKAPAPSEELETLEDCSKSARATSLDVPKRAS